MSGDRVQAERRLLGAVLARPGALEALRDTPVDACAFREPEYRRVFVAALQGGTVDEVLDRAGLSSGWRESLRRAASEDDGVNLEALASDLLDHVAEEAAEDLGGTRLLSASDIFAPLPPVNYLCEALDMAPGAPLLLAGYGYSGKSVAGQDLAVAVASGTLAWGRLPVRQGRVLHLDYEQGAHLTRLRYQRLVRARGIDPRHLDSRLALAPLPTWYLDGDPRDELVRLCEGTDLVLVDSFRAAAPLTDESSSEARVPLDRLTRMSEATGATIAVIHHARKPHREAQGGARMSVRGSGALYDACGSVVVFSAEKGQPIRVSHEKARISGRPHGDLLLHIEDVQVGDDPAAGLRIDATDAAAVGTAQDAPGAHLAALRARALQVIRAAGGTFAGGSSALRAHLGARRDDVSAVVADLLTAGAIRRGGTYRDPTLVAVGSTGTDHDS